ncbi:hypothetical protein vseg_004721 [Gypsophila vaccaria]
MELISSVHLQGKKLPAVLPSSPVVKRMEKVVVIMGPTGSGKSRLSVHLAKLFPGEVINCDKIQVYKGLDITVNKMSLKEQLGVPHHLLDEIESASQGEFTPSHFRSRGSQVVSDILKRGKVPYIVGGSNSFIYALLTQRFDPKRDVFKGLNQPSTKLRYKCCFIWVDVSLPVLKKYLEKRVDQMIETGMVEELRKYFESGEWNNSAPNTGLRKAIGVPEFEPYFRSHHHDHELGLYEEAVRGVKENTCRLAETQLRKIKRLRGGGWELHRVDATDSITAVLQGTNSWPQIWENQVFEPSLKIVNNFLEDE